MAITRAVQYALNTIYPPTCAACDEQISPNTSLCAICLLSCHPIVSACPTCAHPTAGPSPIRCLRCVKSPPPVTSCTAVYEYGGQLAVALKRLKYSGRNDIAKTLRPLLSGAFATVAKRCEVAVAIPLHKSRLAKRGFNQAQRVLVPLAREGNLPVLRNALHRVRNTKPQTRLKSRDRTINLRAAFYARGPIQNRKILLFDDVRTTGDTLHAAGIALRRAGAHQVHCFVIARAE